MVVAVHLDIEDTDTILEVHKLYQQNWSGREMELLIQVKQGHRMNLRFDQPTRQHKTPRGRGGAEGQGVVTSVVT